MEDDEGSGWVLDDGLGVELSVVLWRMRVMKLVMGPRATSYVAMLARARTLVTIG